MRTVTLDYMTEQRENAPMQAGTIVTILSGTTADEIIIGIILRDAPVIGTCPGDYFDVLWLSDRRGAFFCTEWHSDIMPASLDGRDDISDEKVDQSNLARVVTRMVTDSQPWVQG